MTYRRRRCNHYQGSAAYDPVTITGGSVTAILRNNTVGAISSVPDTLNTNPATQSTAGRRPTGGSDGGITWDGGDVLVWPLVTNQNKNTSTMGVALWFNPASVLTNQTLFAIFDGAGGASARMFRLTATAANIRLDVYSTGITGRRGTASAVFTESVPAFVTAEFNGVLGDESTSHVITVDGVVQSLSFSALNVGTFNATLQDATGNALIGGFTDSDTPSEPISVGCRNGRDTIVGTSAMSGVTEGIWTPAARLALRSGYPLT